MGRGLLEGMLPYADSFDHKPPLLYVVYALASALPLPPMMGIRALELLTLLVMGHLVARLVAREEGAIPGGAVALVLVVTHYTSFDWWHGAQSEVWEALFLLGSAVVARRARGGRAALVAGLLGGIATGFKPTALLVAAGIAGILALDAPTASRRRWLGAYVAGGVAVGLAMLLPWALAGELRALWEVLVLFNQAHALSGAGHDAEDYVVDHLGPALALLALALVGLRAVWRDRAERGRGARLFGLAGLATLTVVAQNKYYGYHFSVILPFLVALGAWGVDALGARLARRWSSIAALAAPLGLVLAGLWVAFCLALAWRPRVAARPAWPDHVQHTLRYARGEIGRDTFVALYRSRHKAPYVPVDVERLSRAIAGQAQPGDTLCVRAYEPGFYTLTGLWCPSRFSTDFALYDDDLRFPLRKVWREEHERVMTETPPTFIVTIEAKAKDREALEGRGYTLLEKRGRYMAYARGTAAR